MYWLSTLNTLIVKVYLLLFLLFYFFFIANVSGSQDLKPCLPFSNPFLQIRLIFHLIMPQVQYLLVTL